MTPEDPSSTDPAPIGTLDKDNTSDRAAPSPKAYLTPNEKAQTVQDMVGPSCDHNTIFVGAEPSEPPSHGPPSYQPRDLVRGPAQPSAPLQGMSPDLSFDHDTFDEDDSLSEADLRQANLKAWAANGSDVGDMADLSSDDYEEEDDDVVDEGDEEDEGGDDDDFSDDAGNMQALRGPHLTGQDYAFHGPTHHVPMPHPSRSVERTRGQRIQLGGGLKKRQLRQRALSGKGLRQTFTSSITDNLLHHGVSPGPTTTELGFIQTCDGITRSLQQGTFQPALEVIRQAAEQAIISRESGAVPTTNSYTAQQISILESIYFGTWSKLLIDRRPSQHLTSIVGFLRLLIKLACLIVQQDNTIPELFAQVLTMIFEQGDLEIYKRNPKRPSRLAHVERLARFEEHTNDYGLEDEDTPRLQQEFQQLFVVLGGVETCINAVEERLLVEERYDAKLRNLQLLLGLISRVHIADQEQTSKLADHSKRLTASVLGYFEDHQEGFKSANKATVLDIIAQVGFFLVENYQIQGMHPHIVREHDADYEDFDLQDPIARSNLGEVKFADFRLEMAVRLMKTSRLDLRLAGLIELKEVLVRIQRLQQGRSRLRRRSDADMDAQMEFDPKPIEHLCSKLQNLQIVGYIFGPNIHLEIVQRSTDVLVFLLQAKVLSIHDLDLMWAAVGGNQHRSIVYGVYQVLGELCSKLPLDYLKHLFHQLQAARLENWDQQLVDLARSLFHAMVQRGKYNPEEGSLSLVPYETLLNVLRNSLSPFNAKDDPLYGAPAPISPDVIGSINALLSEGLQVGPLRKDLKALVNVCLQDLKTNHAGAIWSLQVVQSIFEYHFPDRDTSLQFYKLTCSALPELFMANLQAYSAAVKTLPPTPSPTVSSFTSFSTHLQSQEYSKNIQLRFRLEFLISMSKAFVRFWCTPQLAETLWKCLIVDPVGPQEQDEAFNCLATFEDREFAEYVYAKLLSSLDIGSMAERAWFCVKQYFLVINWHRNNLAILDSSASGTHSILVLAPLFGMELIWNIALHARVPVVGNHATQFLASLIQTLDHQVNENEESVQEFREGLVQTCVHHLMDSSDHLGGSDVMELPEDSLVFERCIGILKAFLASCNSGSAEGGSSRAQLHGTLDEESMLTVKVNVNNSQYRISVQSSGTLSSLRKAVATTVGATEADDIRLFSLGRDYSLALDNETLESLRIENGQTFMATKRQVPNAPTRRNEVSARQPTDLLLEPEFFDRIRQIFLLDEKYAAQAWEIVTRLPTNPVLLKSLQDLQNNMDWPTLLDARSPFLLLYSLQILNYLIKCDQSAEDSLKETWTQRFLDHGGQQYLTTLLTSDSGLGSSSSSPTARKALGLMLKVLVRLTSATEKGQDRSMGAHDLDVPVFMNKLVSEILTSAARQGGQGQNDQSIVLNATSLISHFCAGPTGWHHFHTGPDIRSLIFVSMVRSDSAQIRQTVLDMGKSFCLQSRDVESTDTSPVIFFLDILQSFLPIPEEYGSNCSELFEFFEIIAREAARICSEDYFTSIYSKLMETIIHHPSAEDVSLENEDSILVGMFKVATVMISTDSKLKRLDSDFRIIDYIFDKCLFPETSKSEHSMGDVPPTTANCLSESSRGAAFAFLEEFTRGSPEVLAHVIRKTRRHFERDNDMGDHWGYDPQTIKRARCGFVGLQNLGATCYVNSIVQQFFMNQGFRHGILEAPTSENGPDGRDTLLYQLQALFGNLQESMKRSYNAHEFCFSYKDWDGNPMNVAVQMDVDEFFNILFDRLESSVKGTPQEELFKEQYGGKLVQQIKSKDCEHISEREDSFFSIQCEVKNKKTLEDSLQLYVQGEILDGDNKYKCSSCDKHVDAIKRACIKELPRNLILHLKRFDYDMDTMRRIKINDRFEFPTRLDMEPYTLDYLTRKEQAQEGVVSSPTTYTVGTLDNSSAFQYNLAGVLVHTGTADSGHYYSYIKDRGSKARKSPAGSEDAVWYHFNDSKVEEFDASDIPSKAFGGPEFIPSDSPYLKNSSRSAMIKPYSAYMLFYERADQVHESLEGTLRMTVPKEIKDLVVKENTTLLKDLTVFDRLYYRFVWVLFHMYETLPQPIPAQSPGSDPLDFLSMQYGLDFFFSVLIHARDVDQELEQWSCFLAELLAQYPAGCATFIRRLSKNHALLSSVLLGCPITQVREAVVDLISKALSGLRVQDREQYGLTHHNILVMAESDSEPSEDDNSGAWFCPQGSVILDFIKALLILLPEARTHWRNFDEYFKLLHFVAMLGRPEKVAMVREGYVADLVDFYLADEKSDAKKKMGDKFTKPSFHHLLLTVQDLLLVCDIVLSYENLQRRHNVARGPAAQPGHRTSSSASSTSTSSAISSVVSEEPTMESDILVPSASPEPPQPVSLSQADLTAIFHSHGPENEATWTLFSKMIQDRVDSSVQAAIIAHLSSHMQIGVRLLETLVTCLDYTDDERFSIILQIFKELVQIVDGMMENRTDYILTNILRNLEQSPRHSAAYDCLDFFRTISDYGQCGRFVQAWLLRHSKVWLHELLLMQSESTTRSRAREFYLELLSSERAFNGWDDFDAALASSRHFANLLELLKTIPSILPYYQARVRGDEDEAGWRFVDYFKVLTEMVRGDAERELFMSYWTHFLDLLSKLDAHQINLDYDKKEMMLFWNRIMNDDLQTNTQLAEYKPTGILLRKFYVCLQAGPENMAFHREVLPIYFGLVLRFSQLSKTFHQEWAQCHNYTWAISTMKWGAFTQHCPKELDELLQYTLKELPNYRQECWRNAPSPDSPRFHASFIQLARAIFEEENAEAGNLFYKARGLVHTTNVLMSADQLGTVNEQEFFAMDALDTLHGYLCRMTVCKNTPIFAEAMDHWTNMEGAIDLLTKNLMWSTPRIVFEQSLGILQEIAKEATFTQASPLFASLSAVHFQWMESYESGKINPSQVETIFGGLHSPYCGHGVLEAPRAVSGVGLPPMRIGPSIFMHPRLFSGLDHTSAEAILKSWFEPYWNLAYLACKLDGNQEHFRQSVQLAAILAMEQLTAGSLIHLGFLCDVADLASGNEDMMLSLQNPYVSVLMEKFLNREQCLLDLKEKHLVGCAILAKCSSGNWESAMLGSLVTENLARAKEMFFEVEDSSEEMAVSRGRSEDDAKALLTCLQNLWVLGVYSADKGKEESIQLHSVLEHLRDQIKQFPAPFRTSLSALLSGTMMNGEETNQKDGAEVVGSQAGLAPSAGPSMDNPTVVVDVKDVAPAATPGAAAASPVDVLIASPSMPSEEEPVLMTGIIVQGGGEGNEVDSDGGDLSKD